jgi:hypothetical protein
MGVDYLTTKNTLNNNRYGIEKFESAMTLPVGTGEERSHS